VWRKEVACVERATTRTRSRGAACSLESEARQLTADVGFRETLGMARHGLESRRKSDNPDTLKDVRPAVRDCPRGADESLLSHC
jgi:hypothetical protein